MIDYFKKFICKMICWCYVFSWKLKPWAYHLTLRFWWYCQLLCWKLVKIINVFSKNIQVIVSCNFRYHVIDHGSMGLRSSTLPHLVECEVRQWCLTPTFHAQIDGWFTFCGETQCINVFIFPHENARDLDLSISTRLTLLRSLQSNEYSTDLVPIH